LILLRLLLLWLLLMVNDTLVSGVLRDASLHARRADLGQKVDSARRVREGFLVFCHHGVLNCGWWDVAERGSTTWHVLASSTSTCSASVPTFVVTL
jgi:hypothetical protein